MRKELDYYSEQQQKHRERVVRQEKQAAFKAMEYQKQKDVCYIYLKFILLLKKS